MLREILAQYNKRRAEIGNATSREMWAPLQFAYDIQAGRGIAHLERMIEVLETYPFEFLQESTMIAREPIGVCGNGREYGKWGLEEFLETGRDRLPGRLTTSGFPPPANA